MLIHFTVCEYHIHKLHTVPETVSIPRTPSMLHDMLPVSILWLTLPAPFHLFLFMAPKNNGP